MTLALASPTSLVRPRRAVPRIVAPPVPFTLPHFRAWASDLILDTGDSWVPEDFFEAFLEDVFVGIPECWLIVPEGNTKTTGLAGLTLYHAEFRPHAAVPWAAASREQAEIGYRQAEGFVLRSPRLHESVFSDIQAAKGKRKTDVPRFLCLEGYRRINHFAGGRIQIFAADDRTGDGIIPTLGVIDEPHRQRDLSLYRTWAGKITKRGGQIAAISTSGEPGSDFEVTREAIRRGATETTRKGSFLRARSPRVVLHEWALAADAQPDDFAAVKAANPFSGITIPMLQEKFNSPTMTMQHWLRYVCNRPTRDQDVAITEVEWAKAKTADEIPEKQPIWLGLDVAWKYDTTAMVPFWPRDKEYRLFGPARILTPPRDGTMLDGRLIEGELVEIHKRNPIATVVMDMSKAEQLAQWISSEFGAVVLDRSQTNAWAAQDYERFMDALRQGWLKHSGDAEFTTHVLNAIARLLPYGDHRFDRPSQTRISAEQNRRVIDALTAASMVHGLAAAEFDKPPEAPKSRKVLFA